ncbi:hypothetical protein GXW83_09900 [Streptacidiphilus sp. PB12-B1b]|uniref:hypothetical protein n=1 Tax=Streptacidiphilus sp. PB12-B1b TaxID=2705012 RepID=UPI0015FAAB71|nr:hypothetical protein [Streptacidiphilus sp. PB12-B1b]QMU76003.1 hypothetical protein GXW83_09900 [Streptacidiphilus sp. PB12-B1b]
MHDRTIEAALPMPDSPGRLFTDAQLHARACIVCGRPSGELLRAGHVRTEVRPGEHLVWAVVACPEHRGAAS